MWRIYHYVEESERKLIIERREEKRELGMGEGAEGVRVEPRLCLEDDIIFFAATFTSSMAFLISTSHLVISIPALCKNLEHNRRTLSAADPCSASGWTLRTSSSQSCSRCSLASAARFAREALSSALRLARSSFFCFL